MTTDTSRETVEGLALCLWDRGYKAEAATLQALLAERDHWREYSSSQGAVLQSGVVVPTQEYAALLAEREAARAEVARLREAALDSLSALVAAHWLLKAAYRDKKPPNKCAASDRMFEQCLEDYAKSIRSAQAALAGGRAP